MARLWLAEHQTLEIEVAVKLLNPELAQDGQWLARFSEGSARGCQDRQRARRARGRLRHDAERRELLIVMELLRGEKICGTESSARTVCNARRNRAHRLPDLQVHLSPLVLVKA